MSKIYQNDVGVILKVNTGKTITGAGLVRLRIQRPFPTDDEVDWEASVVSGTYLHYTIESGDLPVAGIYRGNAYVQNLPTFHGLGDSFEFEVFPKGE